MTREEVSRKVSRELLRSVSKATIAYLQQLPEKDYESNVRNMFKNYHKQAAEGMQEVEEYKYSKEIL